MPSVRLTASAITFSASPSWRKPICAASLARSNWIADRESGSAGMPRAPLFPYTTLFRSVMNAERASYGIGDYIFGITQLAQTNLRSEFGKIELDRRSGERVSRNAESATLSLHDALPICYECRACVLRHRRLHFRHHPAGANQFAQRVWQDRTGSQIGRAGQQECRERHSFPTRRSSDLL